jgi:uncharacterized protein
MIIKVRVSAGAKTEKVEKMDDGSFKVRVSLPPEKGKANERVVELLAEYFKVSKAKVAIISGNTFREKSVLVDL